MERKPKMSLNASPKTPPISTLLAPQLDPQPLRSHLPQFLDGPQPHDLQHAHLQSKRLLPPPPQLDRHQRVHAQRRQRHPNVHVLCILEHEREHLLPDLPRQERLAVLFGQQLRRLGAADEELFELVVTGQGRGVDGVCVFDVVVDAHAAIAAPVGAVVGVIGMDLGAEAHDDLAGVFPRSGLSRWSIRLWGRGPRVEKGELEVVEEVLFVEEVVALGFEAFACGGVLGYEADVVDGADVEHGGG